MSGQRARSAVAADHRSVHPNFPGVPWWGAVVLALTFIAIGFAFDAGAGTRELGSVFAVCFGLGCVLAVLAVRQSGLFTAVIQPPLLLFVTVPGAYFLFHSSEINGLKDLAINCGYPLIERFPLMFFTSALVLLIGAARWYLGRTAHVADANPAGPKKARATGGARRNGLLAAVGAKVAAATHRDAAAEEADDALDEEPPRRRRTAERPRRSTRAARPTKSTAERTRGSRDPSARSAARTPTERTPPRSRHARPADTEIIEPITERPRRTRPARSEDSAEPRRRRERDGRDTPRRSRERQPRERQPREKLPPQDHRTYERPERRRRYEDFDDYEPFSANGSAGSSTHHPVSRVRYRGGDEDLDERSEYRSRPRARRSSWDPDGWEYDV
ncbi:DUF6542 domain-containing protein [Mycobacterium sp. WMMD1722]|uniref:DUF6542 domain-containing protein n=1 Tax=Mycobacterium sp. WMMD1722 TaxID=3404117 RepID=UPI003BF47E06